MPLHLARRVIALKPSASIAAKQKVSDMQAAGQKIIDLTIGEPDLDTPAHIVDAAVQAMAAGETHYTLTPGTPALRRAVIDKLKRDNGLDYALNEVVVGSGAKQLIFEAFAATLDDGDQVIVPAPYWVSYPDIAAIHGGQPVIVDCPESCGFKLTPAALEAAITPRTKWLVLNSPNNPTGAIYARDELAALAQVLRRHPQVWVMTDEIYEHLIYDGHQAVTPVQVAPDLKDRSLIINGVSKAYAMTGFRVGYAAGPAPLIAAMAKLISQSTTCASSVSQAAAAAALSGDQTCVRETAEIFCARRDRMVEILNGTPGIDVKKPGGAFYLYPSVAGLIGKVTPQGKVLETDLDVSLYLLEAARVAVLDGGAYGMSPYLRLSFGGAMEDIEAGCTAIRHACEALFQRTDA
ncbi:aminotransferase class I/II-fold pyridoxal phosphate-dependent enzyme [uncultured Paracoccus sp.]|uniref:aminotransferase class I/II-fold pyridoxal phosphate-dependent enzyme n=1 Tax=uncultured Paracoccus sp. TaxID=189685 RepID=UPI0025D1FA10|nr:aminotransferase class I/II-fold pyridoxal phosphate-dependent enzyme [uncultured Paracoccus sp.]